MKLALKKGTTNVTLLIFISDSSSTTGAGLTGLVYNTASLVCYYARPLAVAAVQALVTQTVTGAHSDGGFVEIDATNMPGAYRLDLKDLVAATGVDSVIVMLKGATNMAPLTLEIQLTDVDLNDGVRAGLTALPNAAAEAAGGLYTRGTGAGQINQSANGQVDANAERLNNAAQSLLDLKDFADAGYDPATNKVEGVKLADTCTTNTDMVGTNGAALASAYTAARAGYLDELAAANLPADIDAILADTANMQPKLGTPAGADMSADIAAIKAETALIVADTGELQTDWANGGRLDLLIDLILADTGELQSNQGNWLTATGFSTHAAADVWSVGTRVLTAGTNIALAKGTGVTGFNDLSAAQVNAECDTALADYGALKGSTAMTESYAADGATATPEQILYMIWAALSEFAISGTTITAKKLDGSTTAMTFTLDDGTDPTSRTRAT